MTTFLRRIWYKYSKLGKGRKKKQVWRRPSGRHNPMREKRKNRGATVSIGYGTPKAEREKIIMVSNIKELEALKKGESIIIRNIGKRKKAEITKIANEKGIIIKNFEKPGREHELS